MSAISALGAISMPTPVSPVRHATDAAAPTGGTDFAGALGQGLQSLQDTQAHADQLGVQAATGDLTNVHDYMIASTQAQLATDLTVTMRNKALDAFNEIMRMQA